jgi:streptogramin lyase
MRARRTAVAAALAVALSALAPGAAGVGAVPGPEATEYGAFDDPLGDLVRGPQGRLWSVVHHHDTSQGFPGRAIDPRLVSVTTAGAVDEHPLPYVAKTLTAGPGDTLWISSGAAFFEQGEYPPAPLVARVSPTGAVEAEYPLPSAGGVPWTVPASMTAGPDGNLWFTSLGYIARMTPAGVFTRFDVPDGALGQGLPTRITQGIGGDLWWVDRTNARIGRISTSGQITTYPVSGVYESRTMAVGPDGRMWSTDTSTITKVTAAGVVTSEPFGFGEIVPRDAALAQDGATWFAGPRGMIRLAPTGERTDLPAGREHAIGELALGADGRAWYTFERDDTGLSGVGVLSDGPVPTGEFTALTPARVLDTRDGTGRGGVTTPLGPAAQIDVQISGRGGVPASGVSAVVLNATVTGPTAGSYLSVWPSGAARPVVSNLNYTANQTVPNLVTVAVGSSGRVSVFNAVGATHVVFDVLGYYSSSTGPFGARFVPLDPVRVFDTRDGGGVPAAPIGPAGTLTYDLTGPGMLPETGVSGVVMNVTVTEPTGNGYLTVHPDGVARPLASNLNFVPGQTVANLVTVRLSPEGVVRFFNAVGTTHVIADLVGFYTDDVTTNAGRFVPLQPSRLLDTRTRGYPVGAEEEVAIETAGAGGIAVADVAAVALNVTATAPTAAGFLTVYPPDCFGLPYASSLNFAAGQTVPNHAISAVSVADPLCSLDDGIVSVFNPAGDVHVIADMFGYFTDDGYVDHTPG